MEERYAALKAEIITLMKDKGKNEKILKRKLLEFQELKWDIANQKGEW